MNLIVATCLLSVLTLSVTGDKDYLHGRKMASTDPEVNMDALQLIQHWGYPGEEHAVTTQDGYILRVQRIPYGKAGPGTGTRPVIFLQHGLECSSTNWLTNLPNEAAGFIFADAGFDVWLGNFRGNTYGLRHVTLSDKDTAFWQFSWDEMAKYDLDAMITYALQTTGQTQLYYMGHSEGTLTAFAKFASDVPFSQKVKRFFALGPVVTVKDIRGFISYIAPFTNQLSWFFSLVGVNDFLPNNWLMTTIAKTVCGWTSTNPLCDNLLFLIAGPNSNQLNDTRVPVYLAHTPAGTSTQNVVHFGQMVNSGKFQMYDYGSSRTNMAHYGTSTPPLYDLTKVTVPTYLFWGDLDWLADPKDVRNSIIPNLKSLAGNYELSDFNHLDFIWGLRAASDVYQKVIDIIKTADGV